MSRLANKYGKKGQATPKVEPVVQAKPEVVDAVEVKEVQTSFKAKPKAEMVKTGAGALASQDELLALNPDFADLVMEGGGNFIKKDGDKFIIYSSEFPEGQKVVKELYCVILGAKPANTLYDPTDGYLHISYDKQKTVEGLDWNELVAKVNEPVRFAGMLKVAVEDVDEVVDFKISGTGWYRLKAYLKELALKEKVGLNKVVTKVTLGVETKGGNTFIAENFSFAEKLK